MDQANQHVGLIQRERHFKAGGADIRTKVIVITENAHKYRISAMCKCLKVSRSTYYYVSSSHEKIEDENHDLEEKITHIFRINRDVYGSRKIKKALKKEEIVGSRRKICRIMKKLELISTYTISQFKPQKSACNEASIKNELNRNFDKQKKDMEQITSKHNKQNREKK